MGNGSIVSTVMGSRPSSRVLDEHSRYWNSLRDPWNCVGAKIPDVGALQSATFSSTLRLVGTVDANGLVGYRIRTSAFGSTSWLNGLVSTSATTWNWTTPLGPDPSGVITNNNTFTGARIVSQGIACEYLGTNLDNKGVFAGALQPGPDLISLTSTTALANYQGAIQIPVNKSRGCMVLYKPTDYDSFNYIQPSDSAALAGDTYRETGLLNLVGSGMTPNTQVLFVIKTNYEALPTTSTFSLVQPSGHKDDPIELSMVMNGIQDAPAVTPDYSPASGDLQSAPMIDAEAVASYNSFTLVGKAKEKQAELKPLQGCLQGYTGFTSLHKVRKHQDKKVLKKVEKLEKDDRTFFEKLWDFLSDHGGDLLKIGGSIASML